MIDWNRRHIFCDPKVPVVTDACIARKSNVFCLRLIAAEVDLQSIAPVLFIVNVTDNFADAL